MWHIALNTNVFLVFAVFFSTSDGTIFCLTMECQPNALHSDRIARWMGSIRKLCQLQSICTRKTVTLPLRCFQLASLEANSYSSQSRANGRFAMAFALLPHRSSWCVRASKKNQSNFSAVNRCLANLLAHAKNNHKKSISSVANSFVHTPRTHSNWAECGKRKHFSHNFEWFLFVSPPNESVINANILLEQTRMNEPINLFIHFRRSFPFVRIEWMLLMFPFGPFASLARGLWYNFFFAANRKAKIQHERK